MSFISGMVQQYYYTEPSDLDLITTTPTREAIFQYLSQVSFDDFPDFILDVLIKVEGHKPVDITDGTGDEKQDILTITPDGKRCLTQCKHKENYEGKYSGDEPDRIVSACLRKNCRSAIFVTNGDLTPQAKGYINDQEYLRGWPTPEDPLNISYWNGLMIWEKIKSNNDILNKWFSGMGQSHGLRSFKFDITLLKMPFSLDSCKTDFKPILQLLEESGIISASSKENEFISRLEDGISLKIKSWYQFASNLNLRMNTPVSDEYFWRNPMDALLIEVEIPDSIGKYSSSLIKKKILSHLFKDLLVLDATCEWWCLMASQSKSFIYLHDIGEPRQIKLDGSNTFIIKDNQAEFEHTYCDLESPDFKIKPNVENEKAIWIHVPTGTELIQLFEQSLNPIETYNYQKVQISQLSTFKNYIFRAAQKVDNSQAMRIRRILDPEWVALTHNEDALIWCFPPDTSQEKISYIEKKLEVLGIRVLQVKDETKEQILREISKGIPPISLVTITELTDASTPIDLIRRGFMIYKELLLNKRVDEKQAFELLKFKFGFEKEQGFDHMNNKEQLRTHTSEIPNFLCDIFTVRCDKMIDIAILRNPIVINYRCFFNSTLPSIELAKNAIEEFNAIVKQIEEILK